MSHENYGIRILNIDANAVSVRMQVFVLQYTTYNNTRPPLPKTSGFFFNVLWDMDFLPDYIDLDPSSTPDISFIATHTNKVIQRIDVVATRNSDIKDFDGYMFHYDEINGGWPDESKLVQMDVDVYLTNPAFLDAFEPGDAFGTNSKDVQPDISKKEHFAHTPNLRHELTHLTPVESESEAGTPGSAWFSPDGQLLFLLNEDSELRCVDSTTFGVIWTLDSPSMFNEPKMRYDLGYLEWEGACHDIRTGEHLPQQEWPLDELPEQYQEQYPFIESNGHTGRYGLYALDEQTSNMLWDRHTQTGIVINSKNGCEELEARAFSYDDQYLALGGMGNDLMIYDVQTQQEILRREDLDRICGLGFSPDNQYIAVIHETFDQCSIIHIPSNTIVAQRYDTSMYDVAVSWHPQNHYMVITQVESHHGYGGHFAIHPIGTLTR